MNNKLELEAMKHEKVRIELKNGMIFEVSLESYDNFGNIYISSDDDNSEYEGGLIRADAIKNIRIINK